MSPRKLLTPGTLQNALNFHRRRKRRIVFTNGAFDILHAGHVQYLEKARALGDVLILGVNTDASVRAYKGPHRPVNSQQDRARLLTALSCVDHVILFSEPTPIKLIRSIRPNTLVKGADWKTGDIVGSSEVLSWGGKVRRISFLKGRSTTGVIEKILAHPESGIKTNTQMSDWRSVVFQNFKLYAVSDLRDAQSARDFLKKSDALYRAGVDIIQLRSKHCSDGLLYQTACRMTALAESHRKLFFINDRVDLALASGAHGVHLGQDDLPVDAARSLMSKSGKRLYLGKSTHSEKQARAAVLEDVDYIGVGPVYETPTKPHYIPAGLALVSMASREITKPFVAIGGINESNLDQVLKAGARRIAAVRALFEAKNPAETAGRMKERIESHEA